MDQAPESTRDLISSRIKLRAGMRIIVGDKLSNRSGNKGIIVLPSSVQPADTNTRAAINN